jgi:CubicO group peptidase (beta-lactamase class C family)
MPRASKQPTESSEARCRCREIEVAGWAASVYQAPVMNRRKWLTLAGPVLFTSCAAGSSTEARQPVDPARAAAAAAALGGEGHAVWQGRRLVAGQATDHRLPSFSITKTLAALAVVRAAGEGWLSLDETLTEPVPEWRDHPLKRRITARTLVNQTPGLAPGIPQLYRGPIRDKGATALALPALAPPGERFLYGPAASEALAEVLRRRLLARGSSLDAFLRQLMSRIGLSSPGWRRDNRNQPYLSTGAEFSVAELGNLGRTVASLTRGSDSAGLSAAIFQDLAAPRPANPMFSAGIWWNQNAARPGAVAVEPERELEDPRPPAFWGRACLAPDIDPGWLALVGSGGKRVYVLPDQDLIFARVGRDRRWSDAAFLRAVTA